MAFGNHPDWQRLVAVNDELEALRPTMHDVPVRTWNALADRQVRAVEKVREDPALLRELRDAAREGHPPRLLSLLHQVLAGAVLEHTCDLHALLDDPRVRDVAGEIMARPSLYLAEKRYDDVPYSIDPYEREEITEDEAEVRDLNRIGGVPTLTANHAAPAGMVLLVQIDCAFLAREAQWDANLAAVAAASPLPADGLLQAFHTTVGDSRTSDAPRGGALVRHVPEAEVRARLPIMHDPDAYPASLLSISALPSFATTAGAGEEAIDRVYLLQEDADRHARGGNYARGYLEEFEVSPFTARAGLPSRMFALSAPDFGLAIEDADLLSARLPLHGPDDSHVLLFDIAGEPSFDSVFGDGGRMELWTRQSDLASRDFEHIVSIMRSA